MKVEKLTKSQRVAERWYLELDNGESLAVTDALIADFSLYAGRELSEEETEKLRGAASSASAKSRALRMLGMRQMSRRELMDKLIEKGETEEDAASAADTMERLGAVNDEEYAHSIVRHYSKKGYGKGRIKSELTRRGVPKELWDGALEEISDTGETLDAVIAQKLGGREPDRKELKRLTDMLLRRGFSWGEVKTALGRYDENLEETD